AYILSEAMKNSPRAQIIATGSEVQLAMEAQRKLEEQDIPVRVISMPSWELFEQQTQSYKDSVIHPRLEKTTLAIEMGSQQGWHQYVGRHGVIMGINRFGASAPSSIIIKEYGFTVDNIISRIKSLLK